MVSPVPAKLQSLHNFSLTRHHLTWKTDHRRLAGESSLSNAFQRQSNNISIRLAENIEQNDVVYKENLVYIKTASSCNRRLGTLRRTLDHNNKKLLQVNDNDYSYKSDMKNNMKKQKFSITLTRDEIEEDVFLMTGSKPNRRPRTVHKQLDNVFPGLWLNTITANSYKISQFPSKG